ncbi:MAG: AMP-binding protein [Alphaproteobacteria bacterium]|nr:AMP-binding protein [Alphaproteobacteria bacterium]
MQKPKSRTTPALLDELAALFPEHEAVVDGARRWSYGRLRQEARDLAKGMQRLGVGRGGRVAILMGNNAEWISSYFAIMSLGASAVALNTWLTPRELAYQLRHAQVSLLVLEPRFRERDFLADLATMRADGEGLPDLRQVILVAAQAPAGMLSYGEVLTMGRSGSDASWLAAKSATQPSDVACILYTSGSTAAPKGVPLLHGGLIDNMWEIGQRMHLTPADRLWGAVSMFWSFGCVNALFTLMTHAGTLVLQHSFEPGEALRLIETERCTVFYGTPNVGLLLAQHPERAGRDLSSLRTGATIGTPEQIQRLVDLGIDEICNVYGLTEAYGNSAVSDAKAPLSQRLEASGEPLSGVELRILDIATGAALPRGELGQIALRGRLMPGYLDDAKQTAASMTADGFLLTGDLGVLDEHGWIRFRGRLKELIKSGGINVSPAEIEEVLLTHPAVEAAYVTGTPDPRLDEMVSAVIVARAGRSVTANALGEHCRHALAAYKVPRRYVFVSAGDLPLTSTGKLQRNRLAGLFQTAEAG